MFRPIHVLVVASCFLLWCFVERAPTAVPCDGQTVAVPEHSANLSVWHQEAGPLKLITAEKRCWFSRVKHSPEADIRPAWGWFAFVCGILIYLWLFQPSGWAEPIISVR